MTVAITTNPKGLSKEQADLVRSNFGGRIRFERMRGDEQAAEDITKWLDDLLGRIPVFEADALAQSARGCDGNPSVPVTLDQFELLLDEAVNAIVSQDGDWRARVRARRMALADRLMLMMAYLEDELEEMTNGEA